MSAKKVEEEKEWQRETATNSCNKLNFTTLTKCHVFNKPLMHGAICLVF